MSSKWRANLNEAIQVHFGSSKWQANLNEARGWQPYPNHKPGRPRALTDKQRASRKVIANKKYWDKCKDHYNAKRRLKDKS